MFSKFNIKKFILFLVIIFAVFINARSYLNTGFPYTHDGENHLARFANYKIAFREGQIPPRLAPNLMNHYGYPVFNYNYPLANILSLPFSFLKINYELTFKILVIFFIGFGMLGVERWLDSLNFKFKSKLFGISIFALSPYLLSAIVFRGNIGEIMALMLLPWLFYIVEKIKNINFFLAIIILSMFLLSHNIAVLFSLPILFLYALMRFGKKLNLWKNLLLIFIFGFLNSLWFWLPALAEKNQIVLDNADLSKTFTNHFVGFRQILFSPLEFGFSSLGQIDSLGFSIGLLQIIILVFSFIYLLKLRSKFRKYFIFYILYFLIILLLILQLKITQPIWLILPLVNFIQFPWRLSLFISILIIPLAAWIFSKSHKKLKYFLYLIILIQISSFLRIKPADYFHKNNIDYDAFSQSTSTANENLPKTFAYKEIDWQPGPKIIDGEGEIKVEYWNGSSRKYFLNLQEESIVVEPTMYYLGWNSYAKSNKTNFKIDYLDNDVIQGRIAYLLPAGDYQIESKFTQNTWARITGNFVSMFSLIGIIFYYLISKLKIFKNA